MYGLQYTPASGIFPANPETPVPGADPEAALGKGISPHTWFPPA